MIKTASVKSTPEHSVHKKKTASPAILHGAHPIHTHLEPNVVQFKPSCPCGGGCPRCAGGIQTKLVIGQPRDKYEEEADRTADTVMTMPSRTDLERSCSSCGEQGIQRQPLYKSITRLWPGNNLQRQSWPSFDLSTENEEPELVQRALKDESREPIMMTMNNGRAETAETSIEQGINQSHGQGTPLPKAIGLFMGNRFGTNFDHVRIHDNSRACDLNQRLNSQAFTMGPDIYFNRGKYHPESSAGKHLLAHELTHVIQQSKSPALQHMSNGVVQRQADVSKAPPGLSCVLKTGPGHTPGTDILFDEGKSNIKTAYKIMLDTFAATWITNGSSATVFIDGYASTVGAQSINWKLSCKRAEAVKDYLVTKGVSAGKIILIAHGESTEFSSTVGKENQRVVVSSLAEPTPAAPPAAVPPQPTPLSLKSIKFTSDHGVMKDNNTNWANTGNVLEPEWITTPLQNKSISQTRSTRLVADVTVNVGPTGKPFDLIGTGINGPDTSFKKTGNTSTGADQVITVTADANLPNVVSRLLRYIVWKIKTGGKEIVAGFSGPHKIYVTYGSPSGGVTEKRMQWSCRKAGGQNTPETIADKIQLGVSSDTAFGGGGTDEWNLLAGGSGDCDNQARLMRDAVQLLGSSPATVELVRASTNAGAGNCLDLESKWVIFSGTRYLIMDFTVGPGHNWNAYEGTCKTAGHFYAITPRLKATDDYDMLKKLSCEQYWVKSPVPPGNSGWGVTASYSLVPKP